MWYSDTERKQLDMSKPIFATDPDSGSVCLLVRSNENNSYAFRGYDWMDIATGEMNSCKHWRTVEEALSSYHYCKISNGEILVGEV